MIGKTNWYKEKKRYSVDDGQTKKMIRGGPIIPRNARNCSKKEDNGSKAGGILQKKIQEEEDKFMAGTNLKRIRVVERGGVKLKDLLCVGDPWVGQRGERQEQT